MLRDWLNVLRTPVDGASLAVFRIAFGGLLLFDVLRYWPEISRLYLEPELRFSYLGFSWVQPWPGSGLYWHFALLAVLAALVALGLFYRVAILGLLLGFSYVFLLDQAQYLNHFYLVILLAFVLACLPAQQVWSLDAKRRKITDPCVPRWAPLALVALVEIVLLYAGLVKLNADWLQGYPLILWLPKRADLPLIGALLDENWFAVLASYLTIGLHLLGAPLLLWRRTRLWAFAAYALFHLANALIWDIGIFPALTVAGTLMFFEPDWPRRLARRSRPDCLMPTSAARPPRVAENLTLGVLALFLMVNILFPLRHWLYPGDVAWTDEGHRFSWRMKLRDKQCKARFEIRDPETGRRWSALPDRYLTDEQTREVARCPDLLLQFAHYLAKHPRFQALRPEVRVSARCSLNGRPRALLIDPQRDLARVQRDLLPADWILPLDVNLKPRRRGSP